MDASTPRQNERLRRLNPFGPPRPRGPPLWQQPTPPRENAYDDDWRPHHHRRNSSRRRQHSPTGWPEEEPPPPASPVRRRILQPVVLPSQLHSLLLPFFLIMLGSLILHFLTKDWFVVPEAAPSTGCSPDLAHIADHLQLHDLCPVDSTPSDITLGDIIIGDPTRITLEDLLLVNTTNLHQLLNHPYPPSRSPYTRSASSYSEPESVSGAAQSWLHTGGSFTTSHIHHAAEMSADAERYNTLWKGVSSNISALDAELAHQFNLDGQIEDGTPVGTAILGHLKPYLQISQSTYDYNNNQSPQQQQQWWWWWWRMNWWPSFLPLPFHSAATSLPSSYHQPSRNPVQNLLQNLHNISQTHHSAFQSQLTHVESLHDDLLLTIGSREIFHQTFQQAWNTWYLLCVVPDKILFPSLSSRFVSASSASPTSTASSFPSPLTSLPLPYHHQEEVGEEEEDPYLTTPRLPYRGISRGYCQRFYPEGLRHNLRNNSPEIYHANLQRYLLRVRNALQEIVDVSGELTRRLEGAAKLAGSEREGVFYEEFLMLVRRIEREVRRKERVFRKVVVESLGEGV